MSVFKARKFEQSRPATPQSSKRSFEDDTADEFFPALASFGKDSGLELTKNDKYCVSRLPSLPPILRNIDPESDTLDYLNGYADNVTKCALVISDKAINVWPYTSTDETPLTFEFPIENGLEGHLQLAILTPSAPGATLDSGLAIIDAMNGQVKFYESVQHAPALGLIQSSLIQTVINMLVKQGEYITLAENIEPAGIVVATSWKRVVLISLRDSKGVPHLSTLELTQPSTSFKLFSSWLAPSEHLSDDIVSIKSGKITNHGTCQEIIVQDASGTFKKYLYQSSSTGASFINHKRTLLHSLASYLENNIDALIPGTVYDLKFYDIWPLPLDEDDDVFVALVGVQSSMSDSDERNFSLVSMKINETGVLVLGSHNLPKPSEPLVNYATAKPKLFIPKPGKTAFVVVGNSVILSDLTTGLKASASNFTYYEPKWGDVINFKSNLNIVGSGYEDGSDEGNAALVFITSGYGVVRIERFDDSPEYNASEDFDPTDAVSTLTSRIQQAIYYSDSSVVDFDIGTTESDRDVVMSAIKGVARSILDSSSPHLPPFFPSTRDSLSVRIKLLNELLSYTHRNFEFCKEEATPVVLEALEKLEVSFNLWQYFDTESGVVSKHILKDAISKTDFAKNCTSKDLVRSFFSHGAREILPVWTEVLESLKSAGTLPKTMVKLLVTTFHDSVYKREKEYLITDSEGSTPNLWINASNLIVIVEQMYSEYFCSSDDFKILATSEERANLVGLTASLYFAVCKMINYQQSTYDSKLENSIRWYHKRRSCWIDALLNRGLLKEALSLAEEYYDFSSIAFILEREREQTSPEYIQDRIEYYMNRYGYEFACKLFDFVLSEDQPQRLIADLKAYKTYLETYFHKNPKKSNKVSWVHYLQSGDFEETAKVLLQSSISLDIDSQENREFNYSVAKLAAIAANSTQQDAMKLSILEDYAREAEHNLIAIRIQNKLHQAVLQYMQDREKLVTLSYFIDNFTDALKKSETERELQPFFSNFVEQRPLPKEQLISLLTKVTPQGQFDDVFADALRVATLSKNENESKQQAMLVWKLLLCLDDWKLITSTSDLSDDVAKSRVKETVMYKTLKSLKDQTTFGFLKELLDTARADKLTEDKLDRRVHELVHQHNVENWVRAILEKGV